MHSKLLTIVNKGQDIGYKKHSTCFLLLVFCCLLPGLVNAQDFKPKIGVAPHTFEFEVNRGEVIKNKIKVLNQSDIPIPIAVRITDFTAAEETGQMLFDEASQDPSIASRKWIKIENPNFILESGETEEVRFSIEVPKNAEPGGHYATVLLEPKLPSFYFKEGGIRTVPVIGVIFLFSVEVEGLSRLEEPFAVVEFNIPENLHLKKLENFAAGFGGLFTEVLAAEKQEFSVVESSHLGFSLRIKNNDIYHIKPQGKLLILANNNKIVGEVEIPKTTILPGKIRQFPVEFQPELSQKLEKYLPAAISNFISQNLFWGKYKAQLTLTENDDIIKKDIDFWVFPWKFALSTVFVLCLFLFFVLKYRKRIKKAIKVLFEIRSSA